MLRPHDAISRLGLATQPSLQPTRRTATAAPDGVVETTGIEPMTPCLQSRCSPS